MQDGLRAGLGVSIPVHPAQILAALLSLERVSLLDLVYLGRDIVSAAPQARNSTPISDALWRGHRILASGDVLASATGTFRCSPDRREIGSAAASSRNVSVEFVDRAKAGAVGGACFGGGAVRDVVDVAG